MARARGYQIYLNKGIYEDDLLIALWDSARQHGRPQEIFRGLLMRGLRVAIENNELSERLMEAMNARLAHASEQRKTRSYRLSDDEDHDHPEHPGYPQEDAISELSRSLLEAANAPSHTQDKGEGDGGDDGGECTMPQQASEQSVVASAVPTTPPLREPAPQATPAREDASRPAAKVSQGLEKDKPAGISPESKSALGDLM